MLKANLHSIETLGLMDGPGIRTIFFFKGCPLRCLYCHNPDTQSTTGGQSYTVDDLVQIAKRYKTYYGLKGGVTLSGGEPLLQGEFILALIIALKKEHIHVTLDTSGYGPLSYLEAIIEAVDLILLDIKHFDSISHKKLVGLSMNGLDQFMSYLSKSKTKVWVRHVMLPSLTDSILMMDNLYKISKSFHHLIEKYEILPYHKLGVEKYSQLGLEDPLKHIDAMDRDDALQYEDYLNNLLRSDHQTDVKKCAI